MTAFSWKTEQNKNKDANILKNNELKGIARIKATNPRELQVIKCGSFSFSSRSPSLPYPPKNRKIIPTAKEQENPSTPDLTLTLRGFHSKRESVGAFFFVWD